MSLSTCPTRRERHDTATGASLSAWPVGHPLLRRQHERRCLQGTSTSVTLLQICSPSHRHCADAVLSLSNHATVVSQVALPLVNFCTRWVQSPSGFDFLVASTMPTDWVEVHKPVLSTRKMGHSLYTRFSFAEPFGKTVLCHRMCTGPLRAKAGKTNAKITCMTCGSTCSVQKVTTDRTTMLGRQSMVKVVYPQEQYPTEWKLPNPGAKFTEAVHPTSLPAQNSPVVTSSLETIRVPIPPAQEPPIATSPVQEPPVVTPPVQEPPVASSPVHTPRVATPPVQKPQIAAPPVRKPQVATPPLQIPQVATPPVQRPRVVTRSSRQSQAVPPPVTNTPPGLSFLRAALRELSPPPISRTRSLPVASGSTSQSTRLVITIPGRSLAHSKSASTLSERPDATPDPAESSVATRRKRSTTVTSSSSNPKRPKKSSRSGPQ